ncbi:folylpolyglutamate synthase [Microthyrium microscopicum]|uniref:tetrahydrofolate synthase n=1 Tax=Microthyrium microscopicum TaxID=703497 RepID=A0A6A6USM6_9PEZI|nr:folylpolyglutamate synthase [Microthyrium microscopicum]
MSLRSINEKVVDRSYKNAIRLIKQRRRPQRPSAEITRVKDSSHQRGPNGDENAGFRGVSSLDGMKGWLEKIGHSLSDINKLNVIHVAGTKGKGSTCAFTSSLLMSYSERVGFPKKVGLYSSPHLIFPEERIRINSDPIKRNLLAKYFFEVYDALSLQDVGVLARPRYLQLFLLVALHAFIREGVDAAVIETHHGGEFDATNVVEQPVVTAIASLGMDHVAQLGPKLENIAWHKAGIMKSGAKAFSAPQAEEAAEVLRKRSIERATDLKFVDYDPSLDGIGLSPKVQRLNCSLALAVARAFIFEKSPDKLPLVKDDIVKGVKQFSWPGRFQRVTEGTSQWYLDGAHNEMSVVEAAAWFKEETERESVSSEKILIFSQISDQRSSTDTFRKLAEALSDVNIQHLVLTVYEADQDLESVADVTPDFGPEFQQFAEIWQEHQPQSAITYEPTVHQSIEKAQEIGQTSGGMQVLVTGSQHLVGAALFDLCHSTPQ